MLADFACVCCAGTSVSLQELDVTLRSRARRSWLGAAAVGVREKKKGVGMVGRKEERKQDGWVGRCPLWVIDDD